ncbi:MAG: leucine-rich repeat domain-containing protein, partial [Clostridia bacterium]|nr:leucine-rich repeat domain-containing protein [Clostridia bacterium]
MKKIILLILAISCILASFLLVSCGSSESDNTQTRCKHEFKAPVVLKEPSCAEDGYEFTECRLCNYGTVKTIYSTNGGHKVEKIPAVNADCFNEGLSEGEKCSLCDEILKGQMPTGKVKHAYSDGICMVCGASANSEGIEYILNYDKTYSVKSIGSCTSEHIVIPEEYEGAKVTAILDGAFKGCKELKSVEVPNTVTKIGKGAFEGCVKLEKLVLPFIGGSLNTNGTPSKSTLFGYIFGEEKADGCYGVKQYVTQSEGYTVYVPNTLKIVRIANGSLPYGTFYGMKSLTNVEIGGEVSVIGNRCFYNCTSLSELYLPDTITKIEERAFNGCSALKNTPDMSLVEEIGIYAFASCTALTSVSLAEGIYQIGEASFYKCSSLTELYLPDSVKKIDANAFRECTKLQKIEMGDNVITIDEGAFYGCSALTEINIPSSLETLGKNAFRSCTALEEIALNSGIQTLGDGLFYGCSGLKVIEIPASVEKFGKDMFIGCTSLNELKIDENNTSYASSDGVLYSKDLKTLILYMPGREGTVFEIPETVERIEAYAFYCNESLKSVVIGNNVKEVGEYEFAKSALTSVVFNANMTEVPARAFYECAKLTTVEIGENVTKIGDYAFYGAGFEEVILPENVKEIGKYSYAKNINLEKLNVPSNVKTLGEASFYSCTSLVDLTFEDGVQKIGKHSFNGCTGLKNVKIGVGVSTIESQAFSGCTSL